jgi:hypothetical protein
MRSCHATSDVQIGGRFEGNDDFAINVFCGDGPGKTRTEEKAKKQSYPENF